MYKSLPIAVIALLLIGSPLTMFGNSNSNLFSKAMAIEEDGSESDIIMKSNEFKDKPRSSGAGGHFFGFSTGASLSEPHSAQLR